MSATIGEYNGKPTLSLNPDSKWPFTFGMAKAKAILENLDAIKAFVASDGKSIAAQQPAGGAK